MCNTERLNVLNTQYSTLVFSYCDKRKAARPPTGHIPLPAHAWPPFWLCIWYQAITIIIYSYTRFWTAPEPLSSKFIYNLCTLHANTQLSNYIVRQLWILPPGLAPSCHFDFQWPFQCGMSWEPFKLHNDENHLAYYKHNGNLFLDCYRYHGHFGYMYLSIVCMDGWKVEGYLAVIITMSNYIHRLLL